MEYMSQEGYDKLVAELRHLESVELPAVRDAIAEAIDWASREKGGVVICGSLFLAGAACDHFHALPWKGGTTTPSELLKGTGR